MNFYILTPLFLLICIITPTESNTSPEDRIFASSLGFFNAFLRLFRVIYTFGKEFRGEMEYNSISHLGYNHLQSATNNEAAEVVRGKRKKGKIKKKLIFFPEESCVSNGTSTESMAEQGNYKTDLKYEFMNFTIDDYLSEMNDTVDLMIIDNSSLFSRLNRSYVVNTTLITSDEYMNLSSTEHGLSDNYEKELINFIKDGNDTHQEDKAANNSPIFKSSDNTSNCEGKSNIENPGIRGRSR
ncbi:hypothetical protein RS030_193024 [Cryptosporidium xiaoi]|uniref:Uncharacterized protein n=1 Tax=Cryptosporidium xiaoi TaxID=659607 RepID=A0AAV9XYW9_9CRYT